MIDSRELRIGNLIENFGGLEVVLTGPMLCDIDNNLIIVNPIYITHDFLLNSGFKSGRYWYDKSYFTECPESSEIMTISHNLMSGRTVLINTDEEDSEDDYNIPFYTSKPIKYVHEIQNLYYSLTGKEL